MRNPSVEGAVNLLCLRPCSPGRVVASTRVSRVPETMPFERGLADVQTSRYSGSKLRVSAIAVLSDRARRCLCPVPFPVSAPFDRRSATKVKGARWHEPEWFDLPVQRRPRICPNHPPTSSHSLVLVVIRSKSNNYSRSQPQSQATGVRSPRAVTRSHR